MPNPTEITGDPYEVTGDRDGSGPLGTSGKVKVDTDVYCDQPYGVAAEEGPNGERMVWKLDKAIYGTVQAARLFTQKFRNALLARTWALNPQWTTRMSTA